MTKSDDKPARRRDERLIACDRMMAARIREGRQALDLPRETVSELAGIPLETLKAYEVGAGWITRGKLRRLGTVLNISFADWLDETDPHWPSHRLLDVVRAIFFLPPALQDELDIFVD